MKRAALIAVLAAAAALALSDTLPHIPVPHVEATDLPPPSGALTPDPLNSDFTGGEPVVSAPTNYGFEDGLNGWTVTGPGASTQPGGQSGNYLQIGGDASLNPKVQSSAFTIQSSAPVFSFYLNTFGNGSALYQLEIATAPDYINWTQKAFGGSSISGWQRINVDLGGYAGQSVKIRYSAYQTVGFDEGATRKIPSWEWLSGTPYWESGLSIPTTTQSAGDYGNAETTCTGSVVQSRTAPVLSIPGNGSVRSDPFTIPGDASHIIFYVNGQGVGASPTISLLLASESYGIDHVLFNQTIGTASMYTTCSLQSGWKAQNAKIKISGSSGGTISIVSAGKTIAGLADQHELPLDLVSSTTGVMTHSQTDIAIPGKGIPLEFIRFYISSPEPTAGTLGFAWTHNYEAAARVQSNGDVIVQYPDGKFAYFTKSGTTYAAPKGVYDTLVKNGDSTYTLTLKSQVKINFNTSGKLTSFVDRNNNTTTVAYDGGGNISTVTAPGGRQFTFTVASGRITQVQDQLSRTVGFTYDGNGDLWKVTDVKAGITTFTYTNHRLATITDSLNQLQLTNTYDEAGRVVERKDAMNGITCFYYGAPPGYTSTNCPGVSPAPAAGELVKVDPRGNKETHTFDKYFRETGVKDALGNVTLFTYEAPGALCSPTDNGNRCSITDPLNHVTSFTYDSKGNLLTETNPLNKTWTYTYSTLNDVDLETDPLLRQTDYIYDSVGNLTRVAAKDAGGAVKALACFERDSSGSAIRVVLSTDLVIPPGVTDQCTGNRTQLGYDIFGLETCQVNARFSSPSQACDQVATKAAFAYDNGGRLTSVTNELRQPVGAAESGTQCGTPGTGNGVDDDSDTVKDDGCPNVIRTYDNLNNVLTAIDAVGNKTTHDFNIKGFHTGSTDANRAVVGTTESGSSQCGAAGTGNGVDDDGDTVKDDGCPSMLLTYDAAGRLTGTTDALGKGSTFGYDGNGNTASITNARRQPVSAAESSTQCGSAGTGNGVDDDGDTIKDDGCPSTKYAYDASNRLQSETDALSRVRSYEYWGDSALKQRTDARNLVTKYFYDAAQRLDLIEYWNGTLVSSVDYGYDDVGNGTSMVDPTGTTSYVYDALNRMTSTTAPGSLTVSYRYDNTGAVGEAPAAYPGQRTKITYPDSKTATYTFEADGGMKTVKDWDNKTTTYTYDNAGRLTTTDLPNGVQETRSHDAADRLLTILTKKGNTTIVSYTYTLDKVGNRTQVVDTIGTTTLGSDANYQLTSVTYPNADTQSYTYDAMGNRLTKVHNGSPTSSAYDDADQMTAAGGVSYGYDNNGNQTGRGSDTFTYNHENRMTSTNIGGTAGSYVYNGDGLRTSRTQGATTVTYTWDVGAGLPAVLRDSQGNNYLYGLDLISITDSANKKHYYHTDGLGSTTALTNAQGQVKNTYQYDVFGAVRSQTGTIPNEFKFTGEQVDGSGLQFLRARYYDPAIGRFLGRDPVPFLQRYAYAGNNPVNSIDPTGENPAALALGAVVLGNPYVLGAVAAALAACALQDALANLSDAPSCRALLAELFALEQQFMREAALLVLSSALDQVLPIGLSGVGESVISFAKGATGKEGGRYAGDPRTARQIIADEKKGSVHREFPSEWYDKKYDEIEKAANQGNKRAKEAKKLLDQKKYDKKK